MPLADRTPARVDIVVIGGGMAGASTAYHLAKEGVDVLLLERGSIGGGATAASVGLLSPPLRQPFHETVHFRGRDAAVGLWRFAEASIRGLTEFLEDRSWVEKAELDLSGGYVLAEPHTTHQVRLAYAALAGEGFEVDWITADEIFGLCGGRGFTGGYRIAGGGSLDPGAITMALVRAAEESGARIIEDSDVVGTVMDGGHVVCRAGGAEVRCGTVVYATHVDSARFSAFVGEEIVPIRGEGFCSEPVIPSFRGSFSTHWKLNVWRQNGAGRIMMSSWRHDAWDRAYGKSDTSQSSNAQTDVQRWFESRFPASTPLELKNRWSGVFGWTADFLPMVGVVPGSPREYVISGFGGGGAPFAFACGRSVARAIVEGRSTDDCEIFSPARFSRA